MVLRTALFLTRQPAEADDLAQETMLKAFRALGQLQEETDPRAWVMTILRNTRIDRLRSQKAQRPTVSLDDLPQEPPQKESDTADANANWDNPREMMESFGDPQIISALQDLPEDIRWTLLLVDVEGIDHADAAKVLEIPVGTVKSRVHRGHRMLRDVLRPTGSHSPKAVGEESQGAL